uniref:Protein aurora borealis n=1 Tax=Glossina pallidipes TaxID=7398 RepID=A0A1A9ZEW4_GLOPL
MSSTQFEWTVDEMSSVKPAHEEPHETQFQDSPDTDLEAKAQLAISSYFKEQQVVPSPVFCPLRNYRTILSELNGNTPSRGEEYAIANGKKIYGPRSRSSLTSAAQCSAIIGKLSDSLDKRSFGSLSSISTFESLSPLINTGSVKSRTTRTIDFVNEVGEQLSPIHPPGMSRTHVNLNICTNNEKNVAVTETADLSQSDNKHEQKFTPERSSSHLLAYVANKNITESLADSFTVKICRLKVNSSQKLESNTMVSKVFTKELDLSTKPDDTDEVLEDTFDMEEMQYSQLPAISSNSFNSDTPRGKRRSASRKNRTEPFSANWLNGEQDENIENC